MSSVFSPIKLDKKTSREGVKQVFYALLSSPIATVLGLLVPIMLMAIVHWLYMVDTSTPVLQTIRMVLVLFLIVFPPAIHGSYLMYKQAYQQSWSAFWQNLLAVNYPFRIITWMGLYSVFFGLITFTISLFAKSGGDEGANSVLPAYMFAVIAVVVFGGMVFTMSFWAKLINEESIRLRTGLDSEQVGRYWSKTYALNSRYFVRGVILMGGWFLLILFMPLPFILQNTLLYLVLLLSAMFWVYVMFGNTFPKKEAVSVSKLVPVRQQQ